MSNIYIQEPPTKGKVLLETTVGDLDIELWAKETPLACRNFVQLCLEGYYNKTIFHRVVKGFIAQGGDATGTGDGGDSIYGKPFKDEFHQRLRFNRRGLVACANTDRDDNNSQFFFTLGEAPELNKKHTIFGKIVGDTIFNMLKLEEGDIVDDRPLYPHKVLKCKVLSNPFPDIMPRTNASGKERSEEKPKIAVESKKNFGLLSFGDEAEEEELEDLEIAEKLKTTGKEKCRSDLISEDVAPVSKPKSAEEVSTLVNSTREKLAKNSTKTGNREMKHHDSDNSRLETSDRKRKKPSGKDSSSEDPGHKSDYLDLNRFEKNDEKKDSSEVISHFRASLVAAAPVSTDVPSDEDEDVGGFEWMKVPLTFRKEEQVNALERGGYEIFDPRNPVNKRRRKEEAKAGKHKRDQPQEI